MSLKPLVTDVVLPTDDDRGPIDEGTIIIDHDKCFEDDWIMFECGNTIFRSCEELFLCFV
jgi:hypothetical protein